VPPETQRLALVVEDVDVPLLRPLSHAIAYTIPPDRTELAAGALDQQLVALGRNGLRRRRYLAPSPLPGHGAHRYVFTLLALDFAPHFERPPTKRELLDMVAGRVLALGELTGTAER